MIKLDYSNVPRVCDGHELQHCDESCWIMALEAEVRRLREEVSAWVRRFADQSERTGYAAAEANEGGILLKRATRELAQLRDSEASWMGVADHLIERLHKLGFGRYGEPNTLCGMADVAFDELAQRRADVYKLSVELDKLDGGDRARSYVFAIKF